MGHKLRALAAHRLLNAMIELVVVWRKVVFAAALRVTDLPPSTGWTAGGAGCLLRGGAHTVRPARCVCCVCLSECLCRCEQVPTSESTPTVLGAPRIQLLVGTNAERGWVQHLGHSAAGSLRERRMEVNAYFSTCHKEPTHERGIASNAHELTPQLPSPGKDPARRERRSVSSGWLE